MHPTLISLMMIPSLVIPIIIALLLIPCRARALGYDLRYENCSDSFDCGAWKQIRYPFWLSNQPNFCGNPAFMLNCVEEDLILFSNTTTYRVNAINFSDQILSVSRRDLGGSPCTRNYEETDFDRWFYNYTDSDLIITLLYGCDSILIEVQKQMNATGLYNFSCPGINNSLAIPRDVAETPCQFAIHVAVLNSSEAVTVAFSINAMNRALQEGFELRWSNTNESRCDKCRNSGGKCGYDPSQQEFLCICPDGSSSISCIESVKGKKTLPVSSIIGIAIAVAFIVPTILGFCVWVKQKSKAMEDGENSGEVHLVDLGNGHEGDISNNGFQGEKPVNRQDLLLMRLNLVRTATNNFSDESKLGQGGFGTVYKGVLPDGREIAVKRLSRNSGQGIIELKNEVTLIARLQHRNLVRLLGCSLEEHEKLLIYEYMPNKSVDFFLFDTRMCGLLDWNKRFGIINGIARGLLYLHEDSRLRIIHRDLKASNILLDHEMNPKISDFGMARIFSIKQDEASTNRIVGTYGYMAPEYAMGGHFSVKSDVYSFGILLLEIVSGRKNNSFHLYEHGERSLLDFTWKLWNLGRALDLIDGSVRESCNDVQVLKCVHIGLLCVQDDPADRPTVSLVIHMLRDETTTLPRPSRPAFSICRPLETELDGEQSKKDPSTVNEVTLSGISPR